MLRFKYAIILAWGTLPALTVPAFGQTPATDAGATPGVEGVWLYRGFTHLSSETLVFTFKKQAGGKLVARIDLPELRRQQNFSIVTAKDTKVEIREFGLNSVFEAEVTADGARLEGKVLMGGSWRPLQLTRIKEMPELRRPQEPTKPYPYDEEEVVFTSARSKIRFAGTLTRPRGDRGPYPAVLLMSGSGPDDRNYTAAGHYPFLVLADYLTRRGIAVLRVDDRGVGKSAGVYSQATTADLADDAEAAVAFLNGRKDIDARRIGLIGHSDGALGAALLASRGPDIAFVVMLAGRGVSGEQVMLRQTELGLKALGANAPLVRWNMAAQRRVIEVVKREPDAARAQKLLLQLYDDINAELTDETRAQMGVPSTFKLRGQAGSTSWLHYFLTVDPRPTLAKLRCPVLALNGDKDVIVSSKDNLPAIETALKAGGNRDITVAELPGLNHLFQTCKVGAPAEYFLIEETIAPAVLQQVGDWIARRTGAER
jgi:pimeloyl-ACP methyl ester carboxylesterase